MNRSVGCVITVISLLLTSLTVHAQMYIFGRADFPVGDSPTALAAGDFNGDGLTDLVVANSGDGTVSILLGRPNGTFSPQVTYATGVEPVAAVTGDFNGDGNLDLAVTDGNCTPGKYGPLCSPAGTVSILLGNGDGTFQSHIDYPVGQFPSSLVTADFNGDGKLDLAVANGAAGTVSVLLGNGDGTFQSQVVYATAASPGLQSVVVGDFNGDGKLDLAVSCDALVSVLLGNGDGTFRTHLDSGAGGLSLAVGDFNGDGKLDLVATGLLPTNINFVSVLFGNGDGTFTLIHQYSGGSAVAVSDLNGDGKLDLILSGAVGPNGDFPAAVGILLGNGDGTFQPEVNYGASGIGASPTGIVAVDLNGDGKLDLAVTDSACRMQQNACTGGVQNPPGIISVLLGFGDGTFVGKIDYAVGNGPLSITSADFNNDSNLDLATPTQIANSTSVLLGKGNGTFQPQVSYPVGQLPVSVAAGDLRNNGIVDLVTVNQNCTNSPCNPGSVSVLLGNGDGTFQPHVDYNVGLDPLGVAVGDFRGIGKLDLAVANETSQAISILLGKGDGTFQPQVFYQAGLNSQQVVVGDFNGDVKLDLATSSGLLLGNGDGTFQALLPYPSGAGGYIAVGDFNGDGKLDLATSTGLLLGNGDGTFQATIAYPYGSGSGFVATGDFNQDGKLDLVISAYPSTETTLLLGNGDGTFQEPIPYLIANEIASQFTVGDFNGDGVPDLAAPDANTNTVGVMLSAAFKGISPSSLNFGSQGVGTTSTPRTITISNPSNTKFSVASITSSASFVQSNNCGASLSPGASCAVSVTFSPTTTGSQSGTVTITDSTRISPLAVSVSGSGVTGPFLALYPARQNFSSGTVGTSSNPLTVMLVNTGNAPLNITGISIAGTNSADFTQTNNCGSSLPAAGSCSVNVTFTPTAAGSRRASLSISDTAPGSPQSGSLVGSATAAPDFAVAPATGSLTSQTISAGQSAKFSLVVSPSGSFRGTVNLGCAITPVVTPAPTCALSSSSVQISGSASPPVTVTVATTAPVTTGTVSQVNLRPGAMPFAWTVMLLGSGWLWLRTRGRLPGLAAPIMVLALASLIACGASGGPSSHTIPGTQAGTYSATITASSGSLNHNMTLTVVVQ